jgi:hypothetical protein
MSSNNYYRIYTEDAVKLARTTVIKFDDAAYQSNKLLISKYGQGVVDLSDPSTYKYYLNLAGIPHSTDERLYIVSLDTSERIEFTKANLIKHDLTRKEYKYGTRYYAELLAHYPDSEDLILGVLYAPKDTANFLIEAANAADGTILYYPSDYVETNEHTFRADLQLWVSTFLDRWSISQYTLIDDLYSAYCIGMLYTFMVPAILTIRKRNCKTAFAHSYHVREYLRSHGMLDKYIRLLTTKQSLYLYKNILYIERHAGKRDTFNWLVDNIMTARGLPVYEYTMRHDVTPLAPAAIGKPTSSYLPNVFFRRKALNVLDSAKIIEGRNTHQMLTRINFDNPGNQLYHEINEDEINLSFQHSPANVVRTKIVESVVEDLTDICPYSLEFILTQHLFYYANHHLYKARFEFTLPGMKRPMLIGTDVGVVLLIYLWHRVVSDEPINIPPMVLSRILRSTPPTYAEIKSISTGNHLREVDINYLLATAPEFPPETIASVEDFYTHCSTIYESSLKHYFLESASSSETTAGELNVARNRFYHDCNCAYTVAPTYQEWLSNINIDFSTYAKVDFYEAAQTLLLAMTGLDTYRAVSIKEIQRAMVEIMKALSSYSVHYSSDVNSPQRDRAPARTIGVTADTIYSQENTYVELPIFGIQRDEGQSDDEIRVAMDEPGGMFDSTHQDTIYSSIYVGLEVLGENKLDHFASKPFGPGGNFSAYSELPVIGVVGDYDPMALYKLMTMEQRNKIPTIWSSMI